MANMIMSILPIILAIIIALTAAVYVYLKFVVYTYWEKRKVAFEGPVVPFGNLGPAIAGKMNPGEIYQDLYEKFKKHRYFGAYNLFLPNLVINDPELIKVVLTKEFQSFHDRNVFNNEELDPLSGHLFLTKGKKWRNLRVKLSPTFTSGKMKMMFDIVKDCGDELNDYMETQVGSDVDIREAYARYTTDTIMATAFGVKCNSLKNPDCEFRYWGKKIFDPAPIKNSLFFFAPKVLEVLRIPYFDKQLSKFFTNVFKETFEQRLKENRKVNRDFLDLLMQLVNKGYIEDENGKPPSIADSAEGRLTIVESVAQAFVFFLAGFETSSTTAMFCTYELARNKDIQQKVREEIKQTFEKYSSLTYEAMNDMPYLNKVLAETLRKWPIVPFLNRMCTKEIVLPGTNLRVEKGTDVLIPVLGLHRDPDIYPDPEKFDPERFNEKNPSSRHPYTYLPFGEGPRICIGMRFGLMQSKLAVINTVKRYNVSVSPKTLPIKCDPGSLVFSPNDPIYLHLSPL